MPSAFVVGLIGPSVGQLSLLCPIVKECTIIFLRNGAYETSQGALMADQREQPPNKTNLKNAFLTRKNSSTISIRFPLL